MDPSFKTTPWHSVREYFITDPQVVRHIGGGGIHRAVYPEHAIIRWIIDKNENSRNIFLLVRNSFM